MFVVKVTTRVPSHSFFKPATLHVRYLKLCCTRSFMLLEQSAGASEYNSKEAASCAIASLSLNASWCEVIPSPNPPKKKTGYFS